MGRVRAALPPGFSGRLNEDRELSGLAGRLKPVRIRGMGDVIAPRLGRAPAASALAALLLVGCSTGDVSDVQSEGTATAPETTQHVASHSAEVPDIDRVAHVVGILFESAGRTVLCFPGSMIERAGGGCSQMIEVDHSSDATPEGDAESLVNVSGLFVPTGAPNAPWVVSPQSIEPQNPEAMRDKLLTEVFRRDGAPYEPLPADGDLAREISERVRQEGVPILSVDIDRAGNLLVDLYFGDAQSVDTIVRSLDEDWPVKIRSWATG